MPLSGSQPCLAEFSAKFCGRFPSRPYRVELLLELLVGVVDTELFEAIHFKSFKPAKQ